MEPDDEKHQLWDEVIDLREKVNAMQAVVQAAKIVANQRGGGVHWSAVPNYYLDKLRTALAAEGGQK